MACLICRWFQPIEPEDHRVARQSGSCPENCGSTWNAFGAVHYIRLHKDQKLQGYCHLNPKAVQVSCREMCSSIAVDPYYVTHWGVVPLHEKDNLFEWASRQFNTIIRGSWETRRNNELEADNIRLKRDLKIARARSAKRLATLTKLKAAQPAKSVKPAKPRLVAAVAVEPPAAPLPLAALADAAD